MLLVLTGQRLWERSITKELFLESTNRVSANVQHCHQGIRGGKLGGIEHSADHIAKLVDYAVLLFGEHQVHEAIQLQPC